jgi:hypothetical protein
MMPFCEPGHEFDDVPIVFSRHDYVDAGKGIRQVWDEALSMYRAGDRSELVCAIVVEGKLQIVAWYPGAA